MTPDARARSGCGLKSWVGGHSAAECRGDGWIDWWDVGGGSLNGLPTVCTSSPSQPLSLPSASAQSQLNAQFSFSFSWLILLLTTHTFIVGSSASLSRRSKLVIAAANESLLGVQAISD